VRNAETKKDLLDESVDVDVDDEDPEHAHAHL
jgi:hypothetical protein